MPRLDADALAGLLDEHAARLTLFARQRCATPEDVVQEAFIRLVGVRPTPDNPVAWLYRAVRNGSIDAARAAGRRAKHEATAADQRAWFTPTVDDRVDADAAVAALSTLPIEMREIVVLRLWSGLSFEGIAALTETSSSSAHRVYLEGLKRLRRELSVNETSDREADR
ncbi:MAG: sigma-70 family RNA polymerase sigma factor [Pirellulales bacterium]